ncbi:hypothetical protein AHF37_00635 [Paragonimus kellicotti]|nr:hypothetical protein AHF37_00635 [Paragonimus kellicotti]
MTLVLKNMLMYVHQTSAQQARAAIEDHSTDKPQPSLTLRSRTHYMLMEKRRHSTKYFNDLVGKLTRIEGRDANEVVQQSLVYLVNNELARKISWSGANGKLPIYNAWLLDVIRCKFAETVCLTLTYRTLPQKLFWQTDTLIQ